MVFAVVVVAELLAFILVLAAPWSNQGSGDKWNELGVGVSVRAMVALAERRGAVCVTAWLARMSTVAATLVSYLSLLLVTLVLSEIAFRIAGQLDFAPPGPDHARSCCAISPSARC